MPSRGRGGAVVRAGGGIVGRLRRRGVTEVVSVRPIIDDGQGGVAAALTEGNVDYLFVMTMPK